MSTPTFEPDVFVDVSREQYLAWLAAGKPSSGPGALPTGAIPISAAGLNRLGQALAIASEVAGAAATAEALASAQNVLQTAVNTKVTSTQAQGIAQAAIAAFVGSAPAELDTWPEVVAYLANLAATDSSVAGQLTTLTQQIAAKYTKPSGGIPPADLAAALPLAAVVTGSAALVGDLHTPVDASAGAVTMTLPTPTRIGQQIRVEKVDATSNVVTVSGTLRGVAATVPMPWQYEVRTFVADSLTSWRTASGNTPKSGLDSTYAQVLALPASTGTDDTAAINSVLAQGAALGFGRRVRGRPGQTYLLSAPLVIPSDTELDMTGCTVQMLASASNVMLQNTAAVAPVRQVTDGVTTAGSTTLTSATATFTGADVGRSVNISGAAVAGDLLTTTIASVTDAATAVLAKAATTSVTGATVALYNRDRRISLRGGRWDKGSAGPAGGTIAAHCILFRHIDGITIRDTAHASANGKYAISVADFTGLKAGHIFFDQTRSDGLHIAGPARDIYVGNISGTTGDDMVAITTQEPGGFLGYADTLGDVTDVVFENISPTNGGSRGVILVAGRSGAIRRAVVRGLSGNVTGQPGILVNDDSGNNRGSGVLEDIRLENITIVPPANREVIYSQCKDIRGLRITGVHNADATRSVRMVRFYASAGTNVIVRDVQSTASGTGGHIVQVDGATVLSRLLIDGVQVSGNAGAMSVIYVNDANTVITDLVMRSVQAAFVTGSCYVLDLGAGNTIVARASLSDVHASNTAGGGGLIRATGTAGSQVLGTLELANIVQDKLAWLIDTSITGIVLHLSNVTSTNPSAGIANVRATADVTFSGAGLDLTAGGSGLNVAAGGLARSKSFGFRVDVSKLAKTAGDMAWNTNAALACGTGPVLTDGTTWKHLYSGATY